MILVVSDIHLGYKKCNEDAFSEFLDIYKPKDVDHLILLGDVFDLWRRNNSELIVEHENILEKLCKFNANNVHYIVGNHDYYMLKLNERYGNYPFTVSRSLRLRDGGNSFYFIHGYEFEVLGLEPMTLEMYEEFSEKMCYSENVIGGIASSFWDLFQIGKDEMEGFMEKMKKNPQKRLGDTVEFRGEEKKERDVIMEFAVSTGKSFLLGMKPNERLVFGHTHRPFINEEKTVANTGSWVDELKSKDEQNSFVKISNGEMELKYLEV